MVRSLATWTKTLSFPARISPNNKHKDNNSVVVIDVNHTISPTVTPTLSNNSLTKNSNNNYSNNNNTEYVNNIMNCSPISDVSKVSFILFFFNAIPIV